MNIKRCWRHWLPCIALCLLALVGCGNDAHPTTNAAAGSGRLGAPCMLGQDCASGLCVRASETGGICSIACQSDASCPKADNWGCLSASNASIAVCACRTLNSQEVCGDGLDNDCDGNVDDCRTCGGVQVADDDHENCGACGNACRDIQTCRDGSCECPQGTNDCAGECIDSSSDAANCGGCGKACNVGESCVAGNCQCPLLGDSYCPGVGCTNLDRNPDNCGDCGTACSLTRECSAGVCKCPSTAAPDFCAGVGCVDLQASANHCGTCGAACDVGQVCNAGTCSCPAGKELCDGLCTDQLTDELNCGACGATCGPQQSCIQGSCGCNLSGYSACGADCVNVTSDAAHCGDCNTACGDGERCQAGKCDCESQLYCGAACMAADDDANCGSCGNACPGNQSCLLGECACDGFGLSACGASCVDLDADEANCGACGAKCRSGEVCYLGGCECPAGQTYCQAAGKCVSLGSDIANCGACGNACDPTEVCSGGTCKCSTAGALYCASENSCVDTLKNTKHCGGCGVACNPTETCTGGTCGCPTYGQQFCATTKGCTDTLSNTAHCGACDKPCRATEICSSGYCGCPSYNQQYCANALGCVDLTTDSKNCGACGSACPSAQQCSAGKCVCVLAGLSVCSGSCHDLQTDEQDCGSCGTVCTDKYSCLAGSCKCPNPTPGTEVRLFTDANENFRIAAAWDGTNVGVAYVTTATVGAGNNLYVARVKPDGTLVATSKVTSYAVSVEGVHASPALVWTGTEYGLLWVQSINDQGMYDIMFRRMSPNGTFPAAAIKIAASAVVNQGGSFYTYRVYNAGLAWSSVYGGYAATYVREGNSGTTVFRRLGVDGTAPELENEFAAIAARDQPQPLVAVPDGSWGIGAIYGSQNATVLQLINADGSKTEPVHLMAPPVLQTFYGPSLIHDGQTFVTTWTDRPPNSNYYAIYLNRGTVPDSPPIVLQGTASTTYCEAALAKAGNSLALGYTRSDGSAQLRFGMQRFSIPAGVSSAVKPIHDAVDITSASTVQAGGGDVALVSTTSGQMLAVWADTRWGKRQLYAAPLDLHDCP